MISQGWERAVLAKNEAYLGFCSLLGSRSWSGRSPLFSRVVIGLDVASWRASEYTRHVCDVFKEIARCKKMMVKRQNRKESSAPNDPRLPTCQMIMTIPNPKGEGPLGSRTIAIYRESDGAKKCCKPLRVPDIRVNDDDRASR